MILDPIPGDPEALVAAARAFAAGGAALDGLRHRAGRISEVELAGWLGAAERAFQAHRAPTQEGLRQAAEACRDIATALRRLSIQLTDAQDALGRGRSMLAAGDEADALRLGLQAEELARLAFAAASDAFGRIEAAAQPMRQQMAASQTAPSVLVTPIEPTPPWKEAFPAASLGPSIQVTLPSGGGLWREFVPIAPPTNQPLTSSTEDPRDILMPGGKPIGGEGSDPGIRELAGGLTEAEELFKRLTQAGTPHTPATYPGRGVTLLTGGWIGLRISLGSGPTVDIKVPGVHFGKIHFRSP